MKVYEYLSSGRTLHMTLIDPDKAPRGDVASLVRTAIDAGTDGILVGGSTGITQAQMDEAVEEAKKAGDAPVIIFPGSICQLSSRADAVLFLSVVNSVDPYFIVGAQAQAAPIIHRHFRNLEVISTAYLIVGDGGAAGYMGAARPIPYERHEVAAAYALASHYIGFMALYLEAGSGARRPVDVGMVAAVRGVFPRVLFVGGGIRGEEEAGALAAAGPNVIVTGTVAEEDPDKLRRIVRAVKGASPR